MNLNQDTLAATDPHRSASPGTRFKIGVALTTLVGLFLAFDGITKVVRVAPVLEACQKMGISPNQTVAIGSLLLACTIIYLIPRTAILGALLLSAYLGGAVATHFILHSGWFPISFAVAFGVLVWVALALREPYIIRWILLRQ